MSLYNTTESSSASQLGSTVSTVDDPGGDAIGGSNSTFSFNLTDWQKAKLFGITPQGIRCYIHSWLELARNPISGPYCDVAWDEIYCWPATPAGENVTRLCSEVMKDDPEIPNPEDIIGYAYRICRENGTWEWSGWTNYNQCIEALEDPSFVSSSGSDLVLVNAVRYILFVGSVVSFACIFISLFIFYYFKSLRCDRITVQIQLMVALLFKFLLMIVISEPFVFQRTNHYRTVDWICKTVMALQLYASAASISWMFVQGHYLHSRVTTNVFDRGTPFRAYFAIGWGIPVILILLWVWVMEIHHDAYCWKNYGKSGYIWIIVGPMVFALVVNLLFLVNIMRILLTKIQLASISSDSTQFRRAVKATVVLFPLLGANNLLFLYNPGGEYEAAYMITNAVFQASQGIVVAVLYCFLSKEVREAIRREYRRYSVQKSAAVVSGNGATVISARDRRKSGRYSYYRNNNTNSVYCCEQTTTGTENVARWHSFHRRASSFFRGAKHQRRALASDASVPPAGRLKAVSELSQGQPLNSFENVQQINCNNGHVPIDMTRTTSSETTSFLPPTQATECQRSC